MRNRLAGIRHSYDVVVIGAGPAGSAASIAAARSGLSVLQVDGKPFPRHKVCGGCLNPVSVALLTQLIGERSTWKFAGENLDSFRLYHRGQEFSVVAPLGVAVDRSQLDQALATASSESGVDFHDSVKAKLGPVSSESRSIELSSGNQVTTVIAKAIVVATGLGTASCTNGEMEFSRTVSKNSRIGMETIIERPRSEIPRGKLLMAVGRFGYVGLTILPGERLHVAASVDPFSLQQRGPGELVADIIAQSGFSDFVDVDCKWRGTPPLTSRSKQIASERVFLVGDAAGYVEPFTGEGIRWALESGIGVIPMLQKSVANWRNSIAQEWSRWYTQNIQREQKVCRRIAVGLKQPMVRWFAHQAISLRPHVINEFISTIHSKDSS